MGTTRDAITGGNPELCYVLAIEGYQYLLTDMTDLGAVTTAWAATPWTQALTGLEVTSTFTQSIKPLSNEPAAQSLQIRVLGDNEDDQFATDVFKAKPDVRSQLTVSFDTSTSSGGSFNITVRDSTDFQAGDVVHIGTEAFEIGTPSGNNLPVTANGAGVFAPFSDNTSSPNRLLGPHSVHQPSQVARPVAVGETYVSTSPSLWIGRRCGLWVHRVSDGVLDVKAQAELIFAGTISAVAEGEMSTDIEAMSMVQKIMDAEIMEDQWTGSVARGFVFSAEDYFRVIVVEDITGSTTAEFVDFYPGAGRMTVQEFSSAFADALKSDADIGESGTEIAINWSVGLSPSETGSKWQVSANRSTTGEMRLLMWSNNEGALRWLGFESFEAGAELPMVEGIQAGGTDTAYLYSELAPYKYPMVGTVSLFRPQSAIIHLEGTTGTFFDHTSNLPAQAQAHISAGEQWSLFTLGGKTMFLGKLNGNTIEGITVDIGLPSIALSVDSMRQELRVNSGKTLTVKQVLCFTGSFCDIITKLVASTDGNGINHADYDVLPFGAGIPWDLLGDDWLNSLSVIEEAGNEKAMTLIVEKPMKLWDAVKSDFALRMAGIIWKDEGIQVAHLNVPSIVAADWTLTEDNKGDSTRSVPRETTDYLTHTIKIAYNRHPLEDKYNDTYVVRSAHGYETYNKTGNTLTIKARNTYAGVTETGASVEALGDLLASRFMPVLARPMKTWSRSLCHQIAPFIAPGDTVNISDDRLRNPLTGKRGISGRAATVVSTSWSLGISSGGQTMHGEVELLYSEEDRIFPIAPSAESSGASGTGTSRDWSLTNFAGYDATAKSLLVHQDSFSPTASNDVSAFADGDVVRITQRDPTGGSGDSFLDEVDTVNTDVANIGGTDYDEIILVNGFGVGGRPAYDEDQRYYINFAEHDEVVTGQQDVTYQSDETTGTILGTIEANLAGDRINQSGSATSDSTLLPSKYASEQYGDGAPLSASFIRDQCRNVNNLLARRCAIHTPLYDQISGLATGHTVGTIASGATYEEIMTTYLLVQGGLFPGGLRRTLKIAPQFRSTDGSAATVRITSAGMPPITTNDGSLWFGPTQQLTFSTTSTTQWTVATAQSLEIVRDPTDLSFTYLTVEGTDNVQWVGVPECWMEPLA